jgi:hypothetical protein
MRFNDVFTCTIIYYTGHDFTIRAKGGPCVRSGSVNNDFFFELLLIGLSTDCIIKQSKEDLSQLHHIF